jgi:hypothetical protein
VFSVRKFLRDREALLIHFNTPMKNTRWQKPFPDDLIHAKAMMNEKLSYSTILSTDKGPYSANSFDEAHAVGCVGIIADIDDCRSVETVSHQDQGAFDDQAFGLIGGGSAPDETSCAESLDCRVGHNEWIAKGGRVAGIFVFSGPIMVRVCGSGEWADNEISLETLLASFEDDRIFSSCNGQFIEWNRDTEQWTNVEYSDIIN